MQLVYPGQANTVVLPVASLDDNGAAVTTGTVSFYLKDVDQGKYWNPSTELFQTGIVAAGEATHDAAGLWTLSIASGAWTDEHRYRVHASHDTKTLVLLFDSVLCSRISKFLQADKIIDTGTSPWQLVFKDKDTGVELMRQTMRNTAGEPITEVDNVLGQVAKV